MEKTNISVIMRIIDKDNDKQVSCETTLDLIENLNTLYGLDAINLAYSKLLEKLNIMNSQKKMTLKEMIKTCGLEPMEGIVGEKAITGNEFIKIKDFICSFDEFKGKEVNIIEAIEVETIIDNIDGKIVINGKTDPTLITVKEGCVFNDKIGLYKISLLDGELFYRVTPDSIKKETDTHFNEFKDTYESKILSDKKLFVFYVSVRHLEDKDINSFLYEFKSTNPLEKYDDVVCLYIPSLNGDHTVIKL